MLTIEHSNKGYKIKASNPGTGSRGFSAFARDLSEVHAAIAHYYGACNGEVSHGRSPIPDACPLCRRAGKKR